MNTASILIGFLILAAIVGAIVALSGSGGGSDGSSRDIQVAGNFKLTFENSFTATEKSYIVDGANKLSDVLNDTEQIPVTIRKQVLASYIYARASKNSADRFTGGIVTYNTINFPSTSCDWAGITVHEFLHFLGLTPSFNPWKNKVTSGPSLQPFTCARFYYDQIAKAGGKTPYANIPLQPDNTSHWNEAVFGSEIMTPLTNCQASDLIFSNITAGALKDIGYNVNFSSSTISAGYALP